MDRIPRLERFNQEVLDKFKIYNSIFITLPFDEISNTGAMLPLFEETCKKGYEKQHTPKEIFEYFIQKYLPEFTEEQKLDIMFRFIQYIERQVVLFDAIEDASFTVINNMEGRGSVRSLKEEAEAKNKLEELKQFFKTFYIRPVLTAHPTQFYPGEVLSIINDLTDAIRQNDFVHIRNLMAQLGKTPFIKKQKPTPYDEAISLIWYLENVFYPTSGHIVKYIEKNIFNDEKLTNRIIDLGFWPGGDRDGNPFVTTEITLKVAHRLRRSILKLYYQDIRQLKRKLTFYRVIDMLESIENRLYRSVYYSTGELYITLDELKLELANIRHIVKEQHQSLYLDDLDELISKVNLFGFFFATLDIRQNSKIHNAVIKDIVRYGQEKNLDLLPANYYELSNEEKIKVLTKDFSVVLSPEDFEDEMTRSTLESVHAIQTIQAKNGEAGANRYIISNNENAINVLEAFAIIRMCGWKNPSVDVVPLFESVEDLAGSESVMELLYSNPVYALHLRNRGNTQTIMLGFSDGTKDGGYLKANWSIYQAKEALSRISRKYGIKVVFFDGRGGPPARGGGKTHKFYASMGPNIENKEIQLTVQGQTISSNFGTLDSCRFNLENLISAGAASNVFSVNENLLSDSQRKTFDKLANISYKAYVDFKGHEKFIPYLENMSTLKYYAKTNIGSRPSKRNASDSLNFGDLRAIPFVGSWSQLKQNVPGFFGLGTALAVYEKNGEWDKVEDLYNNSLFFKTLIENSMMSLAKSFFPLTAYMKQDPEFGPFWEIIFNEFEETKRLLLKMTGFTELMENYPDGKASIAVREKIVLPLLTIQQHALLKIQELKKEENPDIELIEVYEKIVTRSLFGNINASRNSA